MIAALLAAAAAAASPAQYIQAHQRADGGFGGVQVTAWATLGLRAVGAPTGMAAGYLVAHEDELRSATDVELGTRKLTVSPDPIENEFQSMTARFEDCLTVSPFAMGRSIVAQPALTLPPCGNV